MSYWRLEDGGSTFEVLDPSKVVISHPGPSGPPEIFNRCNSLFLPRGAEPARAWLLITAKTALDIHNNHADSDAISLTIGDGSGNEVKMTGLHYVYAEAVYSASADTTDNTFYVMEFADERDYGRMMTTQEKGESSYNVHSIEGDAGSTVSNELYLRKTLENPPTLYTYGEVLDDLWDQLDEEGENAFPTDAPSWTDCNDPTPYEFRFENCNLWEAINYVVNYGGNVLLRKLDGTFSATKMEADSSAIDTLNQNNNRLLDTSAPLVNYRAFIPSTYTAARPRGPQNPGAAGSGSSDVEEFNLYDMHPVNKSLLRIIVDQSRDTSDVDDTIETTNAKTNFVDMKTMFYERNSSDDMESGATKNARVDEFQQVMKKLISNLNPDHRTFAGVLDIQPGSQISSVIWRDATWVDPTLGTISSVVTEVCMTPFEYEYQHHPGTTYRYYPIGSRLPYPRWMQPTFFKGFLAEHATRVTQAMEIWPIPSYWLWPYKFVVKFTSDLDKTGMNLSDNSATFEFVHDGDGARWGHGGVEMEMTVDEHEELLAQDIKDIWTNQTTTSINGRYGFVDWIPHMRRYVITGIAPA